MLEGEEGGILNDIIRKKNGETGSLGVIRFMCIQVCVPISAGGIERNSENSLAKH